MLTGVPELPEQDRYAQVLTRLQTELATLSTNSVHRHAEATHQSLVGDQADSAAASRAIVDVVTAVRSSQPLAPR